MIECSIQHIAPMFSVTKQKALPSIEFSTAKGQFEREKEMEDLMLDLLKALKEGLQGHDASPSDSKSMEVTLSIELSTKNLLMMNFPGLSPMRGDTLEKHTKSKKGIVGSKPSGHHNLFIHWLENPNCEVCKKTQSTRTRCRIKPKKSVYGIAPSTQFGNLITTDHLILNVENESKCGHKNALIVQYDHSNWIQSYPMKHERNIGDNVLVTQISSSFAHVWKYSYT